MSTLEIMRENKDGKGLIEVLRAHSNSDVRAIAAMYPGEIAEPKAVKPLIVALRKDDAVHVRTNAARALAKIGDRRAVFPLILALGNRHHWYGVIRKDAAAALGTLRSPWAVLPLTVVLIDNERDVRKAAREALGNILGRQAKKS